MDITFQPLVSWPLVSLAALLKEYNNGEPERRSVVAQVHAG